MYLRNYLNKGNEVKMKLYTLAISIGLVGLFVMVNGFNNYNDGLTENILLPTTAGVLLLILSIWLVFRVKKLAGVEESESNEEKDAYRLEYKIKFDKYDKYIYTYNMDESVIESLLFSHSDLENEFHKVHEFQILSSLIVQEKKVIHCPCDIDFYEYHNLVGWLKGTDEELSVQVYGVVLHSLDPSKSYYVQLDVDIPSGDTLIGIMNNKKSFRIYLPGAYEEGGNLKLCENKLLKDNRTTDSFID